MPVSAAESLPRLPKGWPRSPRSAVLHAIALARVAVTSARARVANGRDVRLRLTTENNRLRHEIAVLTEEVRIKDSRMARIPPRHRPHYPPIERMAILELRAARGSTAAETADRMFVTPATIASWMGRLNDDGPDALVQTRQPVDRFPEFVPTSSVGSGRCVPRWARSASPGCSIEPVCTSARRLSAGC